MKEIDEMDMLGFLQIRAWSARHKHLTEVPKETFIDTVWPGLKP